MPTRWQVLGVMVLGVLAACGPAGGGSAEATAADTAAVMAVRDAEVAALVNSDPTASYLADDIHMMPPNEPAIHGIAGVRAWLEGFMAQYRGTANYHSSTLVFAGDVAIETYSGSLTLTPIAGGDPISETIKGIHVYRRGADGTWKMIQDVWNTDTAPPPPAPAT